MYDLADQRTDSVGGNIKPVPASVALHIFDFSCQSCADAKFPAE